MRRLIYLFVLSVLIIPATVSAQAPPGAIGNIVLDVENRGEAWYILPTTEDRFYLPNGNAAYQALREFGLGITDADLNKIPIGSLDPNLLKDGDSDGDGLSNSLEKALGTNVFNTDSDGDGFLDLDEINNGFDPLSVGRMPIDTNFANNLKGRILIQVENRGQAWYVRPADGKRYYMSNGDAAYEIMQYLSIGISSEMLRSIPISKSEISCGDDFECFQRAVINDARAETIQTGTIEITYNTQADLTARGTAKLTVYMVENRTVPSLGLDMTNVAYQYGYWVGGTDINITCHPDSKDGLLATLVRWNVQDYRESDYDDLRCEGYWPLDQN